MGIFSFGKKDSPSVRRSAGAGFRSGPDFAGPDVPRVVRRRNATRAGRARMDTADEAEAMLLDPTLPEKQRARRRLVGALALVVAAVVVLPMVLDARPNPVTENIGINIPSSTDSATSADDQDPPDPGDVAPDAYPMPSVQTSASAVAGHPATLPGASELSAVGGAGTPARNAGAAHTAATSPQAAQSTHHSTQSAQSVQSVQSVQTAQTAHASAVAAATGATRATAAASQPAHGASTALAAGRSTAAGTAGTATSSAGATLSSTAPATGAGGARTSPGARFAVQLGSLSNDAAASNWVAKLKAVGVPAYVEHRKQPDGSTRVLLRAGPFVDRDAAVAAIARVRGAGLLTSRSGEDTE